MIGSGMFGLRSIKTTLLTALLICLKQKKKKFSLKSLRQQGGSSTNLLSNSITTLSSPPKLSPSSSAPSLWARVTPDRGKPAVQILSQRRDFPAVSFHLAKKKRKLLSSFLKEKNFFRRFRPFTKTYEKKTSWKRFTTSYKT